MTQQSLRVSRSVTSGVVFVVEVRVHIAPSFQECLHRLRRSLKFRGSVRECEHLSWTVKAKIYEVRRCLDFGYRISARMGNDERRATLAQHGSHRLIEAGPI